MRDENRLCEIFSNVNKTPHDKSLDKMFVKKCVFSPITNFEQIPNNFSYCCSLVKTKSKCKMCKKVQCQKISLLQPKVKA